MFGAYVAVKIFGMDLSVPEEGGRGNRKSTRRTVANKQQQLTSTSIGDSVMGLLTSLSDGSKDDDDGLLDVQFRRGGAKKKNGDSNTRGGRRKRTN